LTGRSPEEHKNTAVGGRLGFLFFIFEHTALLGIRLRLCMPNFVMIGLTAQKLLAFLFSNGNALKVPQNWGFWRF